MFTRGVQLSRSHASRFVPCSTSVNALAPIQYRRREERRNDNNKDHSYRWAKYGTPLFGLSWLVTVKDFFGIEQFKLDDDPLKAKVKQSWLDRKYHRYNEAIQVLQIALEEAVDRKEQLPITRVYSELANTYYQMGNMEEAEANFRIVINRLLELHGKKDKDPEFIGVSIKLADIFAQKGEIDNAEAGFKHCVRRQMQVVEEHTKKYSVAHGALVEDRHLVDTHGAAYTDPIALFGMSLESYAHFLINYRDETRLREAEEYMDEVMKIYGASAVHTVNILNNVGALLILRNRFDLALKYLKMGIDRILYVSECASLIPGYYCNYAEALFHTGNKEEALVYARKAVTLSRAEETRIQQYCQKFLSDLEKDINKGKKKTWWFF